MSGERRPFHRREFLHRAGLGVATGALVGVNGCEGPAKPAGAKEPAGPGEGACPDAGAPPNPPPGAGPAGMQDGAAAARDTQPQPPPGPPARVDGGPAPGAMPPAPDPGALGNWEAVRNQFEVTRDYIHLAALLLASHPKPVRDAIEMHRRAFDQNPVHYLHRNEDRFTAAVVRAAAAYLAVEGPQIALTDSTTMGLGLLYNGLDVRAGQEILTTTHDHSATHRSLRFKAARSGATLRMVPLYRDIATVTEEEIVDSVRRNVSARTRIVAVTFVHSSTGLKLPIRKIADALAALNTGRSRDDRLIFCVDGVHGFGVEDITFPGLGCDFFVAGTHKWIFGPRGTGLICGKTDAWALFTPTIPSFGQGLGGPGTDATPGGFHSFEMRWALAQAFQFHMAIGKARVAARIHELNGRCKEGLAILPRVKLYTPRAENLSAGIVCFDVQGLPPSEVVDRLEARRIIASTTPYTPSYARVTPGLLNTPEEVDRAVAAIAAF